MSLRTRERRFLDRDMPTELEVRNARGSMLIGASGRKYVDLMMGSPRQGQRDKGDWSSLQLRFARSQASWLRNWIDWTKRPADSCIIIRNL